MEELLSLKWNNHNSSFIQVLANLRSKSTYTDVTLACEGNLYNVHKVVLSTCSDYFTNIFETINCKEPVIILKDIKCQQLEALLDYMYLGEVNVSQMDLAPLIKTAECLQLKGLAVPDEKEDKRKSESTHSSTRKKKQKIRDDKSVESSIIQPSTENYDKINIEEKYSNELTIKEEINDIEFIDTKEGFVDQFYTKSENSNKTNVSNKELSENFESPFEQESQSDIWSNLPPDQESDRLSPYAMNPDESFDMTPSSSQRNMIKSSPKVTYNCKICYKVFNYATNLIMHERIHTGEKPYGCPHCEYWASQKVSIQKHMFSVHEDRAKENIKRRR